MMWLVVLALLSLTVTVSTAASVAALKSLSFCQYKGVAFYFDASNPLCGYIQCSNKQPIQMQCPLGTRNKYIFFWAREYKDVDLCMETDVKNMCKPKLANSRYRDHYNRYRKQKDVTSSSGNVPDSPTEEPKGQYKVVQTDEQDRYTDVDVKGLDLQKEASEEQ